jgi:serine/threonine-protein kinase
MRSSRRSALAAWARSIAHTTDGARVIVREAMPKAGTNLRVLRLEGTPGAPRQTEPLVPTTVSDDNGEISPDGHWLAYQSNPSGLFEISVRPFPNVDSGHWQVSTGGGTRPVWARSGKELFYLDGANAVTAVPIYTTPTFSAGTPTKLIDGRYVVGAPGRTYDVSADGQRFLMIKDSTSGSPTSTPASMVVVLNWTEELKTRVSPR